jgi:hypothetical protein
LSSPAIQGLPAFSVLAIMFTFSPMDLYFGGIAAHAQFCRTARIDIE